MSAFLNSLENKLNVMEEEIKALPGELDMAVACLDRGKLRRLSFRLDQDFNRLLDRLFDAQRINALLFPFIFMPDGWEGPLYRRITQEDLAKWRAAWESDVRVVLSKDGVGVTAVSELTKRYKTTVSHVYIVLGWDQYQKLHDEIDRLIGEDDEEQHEAIESPSNMTHIAIGIPLTTPDSIQVVKVLPKSSLARPSKPP